MSKNSKKDAEVANDKGNQAVQASQWAEAVQHYTKAIKLDKSQPKYFTNRCFARVKLGELEDALKDAQQSILIQKSWTKGYLRKAEILALMGRNSEATTALKEGIKTAASGSALLKELEDKLREQLVAYYGPLLGDLPVKVQYINKERGKGLYAARDFKKGDEIFKEVPIVSAPPFWGTEKPLCCSHCCRYFGEREDMLKRMAESNDETTPASLPLFNELCPPFSGKRPVLCAHCGEAYCSEECRQAALKEYHEVLCKARVYIKPFLDIEDYYDIVSMCTRILASVIQRYRANGGDLNAAWEPFGQFVDANFTDIVCFIPGTDKFQDEVMKLKDLVKAKQQLMKQLQLAVSESMLDDTLRNEELFSVNQINKIIGTVCVNVQKVTSPLQRYAKTLATQYEDIFLKDAPLDPYIDFINRYSGQGLYVIHNCMNHSCDNNAETTFKDGDRTATVQALRDIKMGEEICINYIGSQYTNWPKDMRQRRLRKEYLFECCCEKCGKEK